MKLFAEESCFAKKFYVLYLIPFNPIPWFLYPL